MSKEQLKGTTVKTPGSSIPLSLHAPKLSPKSTFAVVLVAPFGLGRLELEGGARILFREMQEGLLGIGFGFHVQ